MRTTKLHFSRSKALHPSFTGYLADSSRPRDYLQTFVSASGYSSNRSASNFPSKPETFAPTRWLSGPSDSPTFNASLSLAFNPFSLGPRNCLGRNLAYLEMRLILARLLWTFDISQSGEGWQWEEQKTWILWEKKPLDVEIKRRE